MTDFTPAIEQLQKDKEAGKAGYQEDAVYLVRDIKQARNKETRSEQKVLLTKQLEKVFRICEISFLKL